MKLIDRLQYIADEINQGETVADIGTDHGFLPLYLLKTGKSPHVIMADISSGSLNKAAENCRLFNINEDYELRLGNGLEVLEKNETDTVVIAGMGGQLIRDILASDIDKTNSIKRFIIQPRNKSGVLRLWMKKNGLKSVKEGLVREGKFICEILTVETGFRPCENAEWSPEYDYPELLLDNDFEITGDYLEYKLKFEELIYSGITEGKDVPEEKKMMSRNKIEHLKHLIREMKDHENK